MTKKGILMVVSGPSGCGKGTIVKELLANNRDIFVSVSATTRAPRPGEVDGEHYFFLSKEDFQQKIDSGEMLEYTCYCGNYYGTPKGPVFERMERGENVILEIEIDGGLQVYKQYEETVRIFVIPPSLAELRSRLVGRNTEDMETIERRLQTALEELKEAESYNYIVVNDTVPQAAKDIEAIIRAEQTNVKNQAELVHGMLAQAE